MRKNIVVLSDVHANLEALQAILGSMRQYQPDLVICLGDIIGYGPNPHECLELLADRPDVYIIKGNHEDIFLGNITEEECSKLGKASARWTSNVLSKEDRKRICGFREDYKDELMSCVHSLRDEQGSYRYLNKLEEITAAFSTFQTPLTFYGHTHRPRITVTKDGLVVGDRMVMQRESFLVEYGCRYYINVGSVGQQRDNRTDASYGIIQVEDKNVHITVERVDYESYITYEKIRSKMNNSEMATYLVREPERRKIYEDTYNRGQ